MRMNARYRGRCIVCDLPIASGDDIDYDKTVRGARHWGCEPFVEPEGAVWISVGSGYGGLPYRIGQIWQVDHRYQTQISADVDWLRVIHAEREYWKDDGMSFGVGDESGYIYRACCVPATAAEAASYNAREES